MSKYRLCITFTQETDGEVDNRTLVEEFSDDPLVHVTKTEVFTNELTKAVDQITKRMVNMAQTQLGSKPKPKAKAKR